MLRFTNFSKSYNDHLVIAIPELELEAGVYWIRGENGSGKSTLFKSIAGLVPYKGMIAFSDKTDLREQPLEFRRRVNFSEAEPLFPGFLTSKDLIRFVGSAKGASISQQDEIIAKLGINLFVDQRCETYSSGMLKKLSIALGFLGDPKVIILDEPLITLDEWARNKLLGMIAEIDRKGDVITLLSSHQELDMPDLHIRRKFRIVNKSLTPE
ncbi:MAG TPA: ATP-binding cassette domain-containing protein [Cyclobacteriaceae bacterium]|nr:ATP-binding cassette domain-containing protein [Cyclobacteriaceae bacterium]